MTEAVTPSGTGASSTEAVSGGTSTNWNGSGAGPRRVVVPLEPAAGSESEATYGSRGGSRVAAPCSRHCSYVRRGMRTSSPSSDQATPASRAAGRSR